MLLEKRGEKKVCSTSLEMHRQKRLTVVLLTISVLLLFVPSTADLLVAAFPQGGKAITS